MNDLILFGMQGAGKGTQGKILAKEYGMDIFETGAVLRTIVASGSPLGQKIKDTMNQGKLIDTSIIMEVIREFFLHIPKGIPVLFDGIPRKIDQYHAFEDFMKEIGRMPSVFLIEINRDEAIKRVVSRRTCAVCKTIYGSDYEKDTCSCGGSLEIRADDVPDAIQVRLDAFEKETQPVIDAYQQQGRLIRVDGLQSPDMVTEELRRKMV